MQVSFDKRDLHIETTREYDCRCVQVSFVYTYIRTFLYVGVRFSVLCLCAGLFWQKRPAHRDQPKSMFLSLCAGLFLCIYVYPYDSICMCALFCSHCSHYYIQLLSLSCSHYCIQYFHISTLITTYHDSHIPAHMTLFHSVSMRRSLLTLHTWHTWHTFPHVAVRYSVHIAHSITYQYFYIPAHIIIYHYLHVPDHMALLILSLCAGLFWRDIHFYT